MDAEWKAKKAAATRQRELQDYLPNRHMLQESFHLSTYEFVAAAKDDRLHDHGNKPPPLSLLFPLPLPLLFSFFLLTLPRSPSLAVFLLPRLPCDLSPGIQSWGFSVRKKAIGRLEKAVGSRLGENASWPMEFMVLGYATCHCSTGRQELQLCRGNLTSGWTWGMQAKPRAHLSQELRKKAEEQRKHLGGVAVHGSRET